MSLVGTSLILGPFAETSGSVAGTNPGKTVTYFWYDVQNKEIFCN
jgi:hypothetical protein